MNEYDSSRMLDLLREQQKTELVDTPENADLLLLNTCSIREKAETTVTGKIKLEPKRMVVFSMHAKTMKKIKISKICDNLFCASPLT